MQKSEPKVRGTLPDAQTESYIYLLKQTSQLRLTYQIRVTAYMASVVGKQAVIRLPKTAIVHSTLAEYISNHQQLIRIERG